MAPIESARMLHLNANVLASGRHDAAWRMPGNADSMTDIDDFVQIARIAERGTFDAIFLADMVDLADNYHERPWHSLEPTVLLAAISASTEQIGLVATASTTLNEPYNIARRFASLDHVSRGRAAWNIVTSQSQGAAANFGLSELPEHADRYARAEEFADVVVKLWDSFEDSAVIRDRMTGTYADQARVHSIDHVGEQFSVRGPLNVPRSPQGRPVIVQAGSSAASKRLGARWADALFTVQRTLAEARVFYVEVARLATQFGRARDVPLVLPGLYPVIGSTEAEARRRKREMDELLDFDQGLLKLASRLGVDSDELTLDKPLPDLLSANDSGKRNLSGFAENIVREARQEGLTVRQILAHNPFGGHRVVVGSPEQIADDMERWFVGGAADGFNLNMDSYPSGLELFVDQVVPELRRRNLFRTAYEGNTLRDHLGLSRPRSQYSNADDRYHSGAARPMSEVRVSDSAGSAAATI